MSDAINVIKSQNGWLVTKDGQTFTVTDTNGNGIWDGKDKIVAPTGSTLSAEDLYEGQYQANALDGVTQTEMKKYEEFTKLREARDKAEQEAYDKELEQKYAALQAKQQQKKTSWMDKASKILNFGMQATTAIGMIGMTIDMFKGNSNDWQFGGCCNDSKLWSFTNMSNAMLSMSTMSSMLLPNLAANSVPTLNNDIWGSLGLNLSTTDNSSSVTTAQANLDNWLAAQTKTEKQEEVEYTQTNKLVNTLRELSQEKSKFIPDDNEAMIDELTSVGKTEYTEDDKEKIDKLTKYTYIPLDLIGNEDGKLTDKQAVNVNEVIRNYVKLATTEEGLMRYENADELKGAFKNLNDALKNKDIADIIKYADELNKIKPLEPADEEE